MRASQWLNKLNQLNASPSQAVRRLLVAMWLVSPAIFLATAIIDLSSWRDSGRLYGLAPCIACLMAVGISMLGVRLSRVVFLGTTVDDLARTIYEKPYAELNEMQQDRVKWRLRQEGRKGTFAIDEREVVMQQDAERRAFRILKVLLPLSIVAFWTVRLVAPIGQMRVGLLFGAVVLTALALLVMALPEVIRLSIEPTPAGEPEIAAGTKA